MMPRVLALLGGVGAQEIIFLVILLVLLFGSTKIPELARALGRAQREYQRARDEVKKEIDEAPATEPEPERVRRAATDLGIDVEGKSIDELKAAIAQRMAPPSAPQ